MDATISVTVDGVERSVIVDTRTTLLDALRERLGVTSPKKGCDHGQWGACTVLVNGRRAITCLSLAVAHDRAEIVTADGLDIPRPESSSCDLASVAPGDVLVVEGAVAQAPMEDPDKAVGEG